MRPRRAALIGANVVAIAALLAAGGWDVLQLYTGVGLGTRTAEPMQIVAHRGDLEHWPENTLEGIAAAAELDVDGIEFDTIRSADGTWWVIHDASTDRTTDMAGWIPNLTDAALRTARIDGGIGFDPSSHRDLRVPTLAEAIAAVAGFDGTVYVDIQHSPTGAVEEVVALLEGRAAAAILCRDLDDARAVKALNPGIETFLRREDGPADANVDGWLMESFFEADAGTVQDSDLPTITFVDQWRAGEDETPLIRRAWAIGVHAFLTKSPSAALATRAALLDSDD